MKPLFSALIVPETEPVVRDLGSLLLLFDSLSYYLPTEPATADSRNLHLLRGLCTGYAPAPLGDDLNRFNRLLRELENSRSDDLVRLFSSAKSPIATGEVRDKSETSTGAVIAALHTDDDQTADIQQKERLWQARLVLKLAEIFARREMEVRQGLARIARAEHKIFSALEGDGEPELSDTEQYPRPDRLSRPPGSPDNTGPSATSFSAMLTSLRLKAWSELFLADSTPDRPFILAATSEDYGATILDRYENHCKKTPEKLFTLTVQAPPGLGRDDSISDLYFSQRQRLRSHVRENIRYFENVLAEAAGYDRDLDSSRLGEQATAWEQAVASEFAGAATGSRKLDFYRLPDIRPAVLLPKLFHLETVRNVDDQAGNAASLLAILHA